MTIRTCVPADPQTKGGSEATVRVAKADLVPTEANLREGLDVRVHGRYYRDPPEFLTFMHGGTDGLHFGLWYDDGRTCTGVASYYNNDGGGGVGLPSGTPLEAVREQIERRQAHLDSEAGKDEPIAANLAEERFRLRALREVLMTFETGDRPEEGDAYHKTYRDEDEVLKDGEPSRFETLDGGGALADGESVVPRPATSL